MVYTVERVAIIALLAYSLALTARHFSLPPAKLFELCGRDFHEPAAKGSCLCRAGEFCMCTPGIDGTAKVAVLAGPRLATTGSSGCI